MGTPPACLVLFFLLQLPHLQRPPEDIHPLTETATLPLPFSWVLEPHCPPAQAGTPKVLSFRGRSGGGPEKGKRNSPYPPHHHTVSPP